MADAMDCINSVLPLCRGRDNQRTLAKADGAQEIHRAQQAVLRVFLGKQQLLGGIGSRQGIESRALSRVVRIDAVDLGDVEQRAETIVFTLGTHLARDGIAVTQVETADLRVGYVDIPAAGQIIMHAQEAIALGMDFQNAAAVGHLASADISGRPAGAAGSRGCMGVRAR